VTIERSIKVSASHQKQENKSVPFDFFLFCVFPDSVYRFFGGASTCAYSLIRRLNFSFGDNQIKLFSFVIFMGYCSGGKRGHLSAPCAFYLGLAS
jgi:hypothetical protein